MRACHPAWVEFLLTNSAQYASLLRPTFADTSHDVEEIHGSLCGSGLAREYGLSVNTFDNQRQRDPDNRNPFVAMHGPCASSHV
jgi:hypothetical protein